MPKQRISPAPGAAYPDIEVGWSTAGGVQVGLIASITIQGEEFDSLWSHLDRRGCNDLIRHLRRARDAAFGADQ